MPAIVLVLAVVAYVGFLGTFALIADFLTLGLHRSIDGDPTASVPIALTIDLGLVAFFGVSHSVMARPWFKERWTKLIPKVAERSVYVLVTDVVLGALVEEWRSIPQVLYSIETPALRYLVWSLWAAGLALTVYATFLTDHFDFFGLTRVWAFARGRAHEPAPFVERSLYRHLRHPMMLGLLVVLWVTPTMTIGHVLFATSMSAYILVGVTLEERELARTLGKPYLDYRSRVPAILPFGR